jgi:hypothetical protein
VWLGESVYTNFRRIVRPRPPVGVRDVYVRCFGSPWGYRIDLGLLVQDLGDTRRDYPERLAETLLLLPVSIAGQDIQALRLSTTAIAGAIESRTQPHGGADEDGRVRAGTPVVLLEELTDGAEQPQITLSQAILAGRAVDVLRIRRAYCDPDYDNTRLQVRRFRLAWWRAHSELEVLRLILHAWRAGELQASGAVRDVLDGLGHGLSRWRRDGVNQSQMMAWRSLQHPGEWDDLASLADLFIDESAGISRKISIAVDRAQGVAAAEELITSVRDGTPVNLELFTTNVKVEGGSGIAVGPGATVLMGDSTKQSSQTTTKGEENMDPVSLIVAALVAGAASGVGDVAGKAISDAYAGLKGMLKRAFLDKGDADAAALVDQHAANPEVTEQQLKAKLESENVAADEQIVAAARAVLKEADAEGYRAGKYDVTVSGGQGVIVGDNAKQTNTFGTAPAKND